MDLNPFELCSALKFLGYFMILIVLAIIGVSYDAVVIITWGPHLLGGGSNSALSFAIVALFHILLVMLTWSYVMVVIRDPGAVPADWKMLPQQNVVETDDSSSISNESATISMRSASDVIERRPGLEVAFCNRCQNGKPPRCHHCSVCQRCVLKMDHHCIWVVNCVGARNQKFFLLFVVYTFLETVLNTLVLIPSFINFFREAKNHTNSPGNLTITFLAFVLNLAFALSLLCFVIMHTSMLLRNTTSVEAQEKKTPGRWKYDLGWKKNFEQVFGTKKLIWLLPVLSKKDLEMVPGHNGLDFPTHSDFDFEV